MSRICGDQADVTLGNLEQINETNSRKRNRHLSQRQLATHKCYFPIIDGNFKSRTRLNLFLRSKTGPYKFEEARAKYFPHLN